MLLDDSLPARGLRELRAARAALAAAERLLVVTARREHASWREIGEQLGIRPQSVWERYRSLDPRPPRRRTLDDDVRDFHAAWASRPVSGRPERPCDGV